MKRNAQTKMSRARVTSGPVGGKDIFLIEEIGFLLMMLILLKLRKLGS
jgi:hypothetical protein